MRTSIPKLDRRNGGTAVAAGARSRRSFAAFNMIEVVLGIGLISFGLVSVLRLFPTTLNTNRDSIAVSYVGDSADQLLHFLEMRLATVPSGYASWEDYVNAVLLPRQTVSQEPTDWERDTSWPADETTAYWHSPSQRSFYRIEQKTASLKMPDFSAVYRVWREAIPNVNTANGVAINMEVSWPFALPYERRHKSVFSLEVYRRQ